MARTAITELQQQIEAVRREAFAAGYAAAMQAIRELTSRTAPEAGSRAAATPRRRGRGRGRARARQAAPAAAKTPSQQVEALFYSTMDKRASGDTSGVDDALKQVVGGTGVGLEEVTIARDLLNSSHYAGPLPPDVAIP